MTVMVVQNRQSWRTARTARSTRSRCSQLFNTAYSQLVKAHPIAPGATNETIYGTGESLVMVNDDWLINGVNGY